MTRYGAIRMSPPTAATATPPAYGFTTADCGDERASGRRHTFVEPRRDPKFKAMRVAVVVVVVVDVLLCARDSYKSAPSSLAERLPKRRTAEQRTAK